jgi:VWFA-related protein
VLAAAVPAQTISGQQPGIQTPTLRTSVTTIEVDAVVTRDGAPVRDLKAEDFEIVQDGRRQRITTFTYVSVNEADAGAGDVASPNGVTPRSGPTSAPRASHAGQQGRHLVFVVDDLGLGHESMFRVKNLLRTVIERDLTPDDRVAIVRTAGEAGLYQQFTNDKVVMRALVERLRFHMTGRGLRDGTLTLAEAAIPMRRGSENAAEPGRPQTEAQTPQPDATKGRRGAAAPAGVDLAFTEGTIGTLNAVVASMREIEGRKGVILLTDGFALDEIGVLQSLRPVVDLATRTRTVVYSVNVERFDPAAGINAECCPVNPSRFQDDAGTVAIRRTRNAVDELRSKKQGPDFLASETGGLFFANPADLQLVVRRSLDDQRGYYLIGYSPDEHTYRDPPDRFHEIRVEVRRPGHSVRARRGYLGSPAAASTPRARSALTDAALSAFTRNDLDVRLTALFMAPDAKAALIRALLHVARDRVQFVAPAEGGRPTAELEVEAYAVSAQGVIIGQDRQTIRIRDTAAVAEPGAASRPESSASTTVGFVYRLDVPVARPGAYSLRVAVRDKAAGALGSASQFVIVPDLSRERPAVSGLLVSAENADGDALTAHPASRRFAVPTKLSYSLQIYNATYRAGRPALRATAAILREDRVVYSGPALDVQTTAREGEPITVGGVLGLAKGFESGQYTLRVTITDANRASATPVSTVVDFTVENGGDRAEGAIDRRN